MERLRHHDQVSGRAARSTAAMSSATITSTPWSRSSVTRARAPSGDVDSGSIRPPGRGAVKYVLSAATPTMTTSANSTQRLLRQRCATVGPTAESTLVIAPLSSLVAGGGAVTSGRRSAGPQMVVEVGDHPVGGFGPGRSP